MKSALRGVQNGDMKYASSEILWRAIVQRRFQRHGDTRSRPKKTGRLQKVDKGGMEFKDREMYVQRREQWDIQRRVGKASMVRV